MKCRLHVAWRFFAVTAAALILALLMIPCAAAEEPPVLRVAFPQLDGFCMTDADGHPHGLIVDFLNEIAKYTGWKYEYIPTDSASLLDDFFAGKFDLMGGTYYADGFDAYFAYPEYNCGYSKLILLARWDDASIKSYDLNSFQGKTIGVFEQNKEHVRRLQEYLKLNGLSCTLKTYSFEQLSKTGNLNHYLETGEVDLLLGNSSDAGSEFYVAASFDSQPHYIVTTLGNDEVLAGLNMALEQIYSADPDFAEKLYAKNFSGSSGGYVQLSEQEQAYVAEKGTVTVAVPKDWHPLFCIYNEDNHEGLVPDVLHEINGHTGLQFSFLCCETYAEAVETVQQGKADLLGFFAGTESDAAADGLALTSPYVEIDSILVRNKNSSYPAEGLVGAVMEGRSVPDHLSADEIRSYSDVAAALRDVNRGKVDFFTACLRIWNT